MSAESHDPSAMHSTLWAYERACEARTKWQTRALQAEADRDDFRTRLKASEEKSMALEARAVDAERRATHAVGRAKRMGVGFGNGG